MEVPVKNRSYAKKCTLAYRLNSAVDLHAGPAVPDRGHLLAETLKKPSWRLSVTEPPRQLPADTVHKNTKWPRNSPAWLKHDKQVLRFYAFFQETVVERWDENCRYRHVVITYHMEDGTMQ